MKRRKRVKCYPLVALLDAQALANLRPYLRGTFTATYAALMDPNEHVSSADGSSRWWPAYASLHRLLDGEALATLHTSYDVGRTMELALRRRAIALRVRPVMHAPRKATP